MSIDPRFVPRSLRILAAFAPLLALIAVPVQAALPTSDGPSPQRIAPGVAGSARTTRVSGPALTRPIPDLEQSSRPISTSPADLAVAPRGLRGGASTAAAGWTSLGPRPQLDEWYCCGASNSDFGKT